MPQHLVPDIIKLKPGETTKFEVPPSNDITRLSFGPFLADEKPELETRATPADSLVKLQVALDFPKGFLVVFIMQNYGQRTIHVTVRRLR